MSTITLSEHDTLARYELAKQNEKRAQIEIDVLKDKVAEIVKNQGGTLDGAFGKFSTRTTTKWEYSELVKAIADKAKEEVKMAQVTEQKIGLAKSFESIGVTYIESKE
jgi:hypothetical protein